MAELPDDPDEDFLVEALQRFDRELRPTIAITGDLAVVIPTRRERTRRGNRRGTRAGTPIVRNVHVAVPVDLDVLQAGREGLLRLAQQVGRAVYHSLAEDWPPTLDR